MTVSILVRAVVFTPPVLVLVLFSQVSPLAPYILDALLGVPRVLGYLSCAVSAGVALFLWHQGHGRRPDAWLLASVLAAGSAILCFPALPCVVPGVLTLLSAAWLYILMHWVPEEKPEEWLGKVSSALISAGVWCLAVWILWLTFRVPSLEKWTDWDGPYRQRVWNGNVPWKIAEVEWMVPVGVSFELFIMALLCWFQKKHISMDTAETASSDGLSASQAYLVSQVKLLGLLVCIATMVLWIGASLDATIGGSDLGHERADMRDEVLGLTFWLFAGISAWLVYNLGPEQVMQAAQGSKVAMRVLEMAQSEWAKAGYLFVFAPFLLAYTLLKRLLPSAGNAAQEPGSPQRRNSQMHALKDSLLSAAELFGSKFLQRLWTTSVLTKAQLLGIGYVCFEVGVKGTMVSLAYTNDLLSSMHVFWVSLLIFIIGVFLFLLPPTPGPPVYALIGVLVTASMQNSGGSAFAGVVLAIIVGFSIKMAFAAIAQKYIGEPMANSVKIRSMAQVHTAEIRGIEKILKEPGVTAAKVSILIGGPDWPVAVLCGILRLPLGEVMLALSPVLLQSVVPCVLSGSLLVMFGEDDKKKALAETAVAVAGALQLVALVVAGYYVQEAIELHYDELQKERPEDRDIIELEKEAEKKEADFRERTTWEGLPMQARGVLISGLVSVYISCLLMAGPWKIFLGTSCFRKFDITSSVDKALGGNPLAVVQPLGWVAIVFCTISCALLGYFHYWASRQARAEEASRPGVYAPLAQP